MAGSERSVAAPFGAFERLLARRYLAGQRRESFISVIGVISLVGIALGVATLIVVMSVMNGFRNQLVERILGVNPHIVLFASGSEFEDLDGLQSRLAAIEGVARVSPVIERQVLATHNTRSSGVVLRSILADELRSLPAVAAPENARGSVEDFERGGGVALGSGLARRIGATAGDTITLLWPEGERTPFGIVPRARKFPVNYVFKIGLSNLDRSLAFLPRPDAEEFFSTEEPDFVEIMLDDPQDVATRSVAVERVAGDSAFTSNWMRSNSAYLQALAVERNVMFLILTLIILVAALNIVSGMVMLVKEKRAGIAVLRTMGASTRAIMRIFFLCGASIGLAGTLAGVVLGVVFCLNIDHLQALVSSLAGTDVFSADIYYLSRLPAELRPGNVAAIAAMGIGLSLLATLYPSWRAARVDPVMTLRDG